MFRSPLKKAKYSLENPWTQLLQRCEYSETGIASTVPKLENMNPELQRLLFRWDETGELPDLNVEGFTVEGLVEYMGLKVPAAFLVMDWLKKNPEQAKQALAEPISKIIISDFVREEILRCSEEDIQ